MKKPIDLRAHLTQWVPDLAANPDKLHVFIETGRIVARYGKSLSFEYRYQVQLLITDFAESPDVLAVPLMVWIGQHQPNLLFDEKLRENLVTFKAELIDHDKVDIELTLELSERVLVKPTAAGYECEHINEPPLPDLTGPTGWEIYLKGVPIGAG
jgi:hypothetical protein